MLGRFSISETVAVCFWTLTIWIDGLRITGHDIHIKISLDKYIPMVYIKPMTINELKKWRMENGYSQAKLANVLGVASMTVTRWEMGIRSIPPYLHLALKALKGGDKGMGSKGQKTKKKRKEDKRHGKHL